MTMVKMTVGIRMEVVFNVSRFTSCFTNVIIITIMKNPVLHNVLYLELLQWVAQQW